MAKNPWVTKQTETKYDNPWIRVDESAVVGPSGRAGIYGTIHFKNKAVGIIPLDPNGNTWLVGQYRYPLGAYSWEIPEGGCPVGTDPLVAAQRELKEETGLVARQWELLLEMDLSNSVSDESAVVYLAQGLVQTPAEPEPDERLEVRQLPLAQALAMALSGEIRDAISVAALLALGRRLGL